MNEDAPTMSTATAVEQVSVTKLATGTNAG